MSDLKAVSNVIELKKNKQYMFVFSRKSGLRAPQLGELMKALHDEGFKGIAVLVNDVADLSVVRQ